MSFSRKERKGRKERKTAMKQKKGFEFGRMVCGCAIVVFVSVSVWFMSDALFTPSLKGYEVVPCRIVKSSVKMEKVNRFIFTAEFAYKHNGRTCKSNSLRKPGRGEFEFNRLASRLPLLEKYAPGTEHECRVNPENPFDAVLAVENPVEDPDALSGNTGPIVAGMILALFLLAGVSMIASAFPSVRRLVTTPRVKKLLIPIGLVLFGCPFMTVGSIGLVQLVRERYEAKSYVSVPAKVLYSGMYSFRSGGRHPHTVYSVRVGYEYAVDGKKYEGDRLAISQISSNNYDHHRHLANKYKKGDAVTAYVSPDDPRKSVLEKSSGLGDIGAMAFMGLFGVVGFAIIVAGLWMTLSFLRGSNGAPLSFERRILKRSHANWVIPGLFTVVWNVFSWSFVLGFVGEEQVRRFDPLLFILVIFPLVGIFLIGCFIFEIVRELRAPRLVLTLSCTMWKQGSLAQVDWSLENPEEIESLEIALERTRMEGSGKHRRLTTVSSQSCCHHAQSMVPGVGSFCFTVPQSVGDGWNLAFGAKVKVKGVSRIFTLTYPLPNPVV
jgi:hypothetical protein